MNYINFQTLKNEISDFSNTERLARAVESLTQSFSQVRQMAVEGRQPIRQNRGGYLFPGLVTYLSDWGHITNSDGYYVGMRWETLNTIFGLNYGTDGNFYISGKTCLLPSDVPEDTPLWKLNTGIYPNHTQDIGYLTNFELVNYGSGIPIVINATYRDNVIKTFDPTENTFCLELIENIAKYYQSLRLEGA